MAKHHRQHSWSVNGSSYPVVPDQPSHWELFLAAEKLDEQELGRNNPLVMKFILQNSQRFYVPTKILKMYGVDFDTA